MAGDRQLPVTFALPPINFFELYGEILLKWWISNFQFCVERKPANYYSSANTLAALSIDIKETILV